MPSSDDTAEVEAAPIASLDSETAPSDVPATGLSATEASAADSLAQKPEGSEPSSSAPAEQAADAPPAGGQPSGKSGSPRGPRPPGQGKSESSRSRPPRNKSSNPPPQTPPQPHPADHLLAQLAYVVVNEAGASVYSTSQVGREETSRSRRDPAAAVISIGRRLQDPLAELVKIEPQSIGVGLYQHDVNPKQLKDTLESVISSCVNFVGVDLNTASIPLLRHVSGLNQLTARRIVEYRKEHGVLRIANS